MSDDTSDIVKRVTKGWAEGSPDVLLGIACKEIEELRQQRDEARREVCHLEAVRSSFLGFQKNIKDHAAQRGWDCFKEGGGA